MCDTSYLRYHNSNNVTYFIITFLTGFRYGTGGRGWRVIQFKGGGVNATYPYGHPLPYLISKRVVGGGGLAKEIGFRKN